MEKKYTIRALILAALTASLCGGVANAAPAVYSLNPVVVTATRTETNDIDVPATTTVITAEDIKNKGYTSVFDALEQSVGVTSYSYSNGGDDLGGSVSRFYIRGMDKGTLVLVNGAPVNIMNYSSTEGVPIDAVEKIEIIKGSNSVLYGAEAMGGVVNIITKKGGESSASVSAKYGNYNSGYQASVSGEKFTAFFDQTYSDEVDATNKVFEKSSRLWKLGKGNKTSFYLSGQLSDKLSLDWSHVDTNKNRYSMEVKNGIPTGNISSGDKDTGKYEYDSQRNNINLIYDDKDAEFRSILAYNNRRLDTVNVAYNKDESVKRISRGTNYNVYGLTFDTQKSWHFNDGADDLTSGVTFKREHWKRLSDRSDKIGRNAFSVYSSWQHEFTPRLTGIFGARGEFSQDNGWDKEQNVFLPQVQLLYKLNQDWSLYTNVGKSFDMPAINSKYYSAKIRNWNVQPQQGWTYEIGSKYIHGKDNLKIAAFHMNIDDYFQWVKENTVIEGGDPGINVQVNGGTFRNTGVEAEWIHVVNDNWKYNLGLSISNPEINTNGKWVQESARLQGNAGFQYTSQKFLANVNFFITGDREDSYYNKLGQIATKYGGYDHQVPDRIQLNSTLQYMPDDHQTIVLNLYNILDRDNPINENENWDLPFNWMLTYKYAF